MDRAGSITVIIAKQDGQTLQITIHPTESISNLKQKIQEKSSIPKDRQMLTFCGKQLNGIQTLSYLNVQNESKIFLCEIFAKKPNSLLNLDECKQCRFQPNDPRVLSCGHSFCFSCLSDSSQLQCPVCQSKYELEKDFEINWVANSCIQKSKNKSTSPLQQETLCGACEEGKEKPATKWCPSCVCNYCEYCDLSTHSQRNFKNHERENCQSSPPLLPQCEKHQRERELFCVAEDIFFCPSCLDDHRGHLVVTFAEHSKGIRNQLFDSLTPFRKNNLEVKRKKLREEKVKNDEELKELEEKVVVLKRKNVLLSKEINESEKLAKEIKVGELVLRKAIEEIHVNHLVDREKVGEMKIQINEIVSDIWNRVKDIEPQPVLARLLFRFKKEYKWMKSHGFDQVTRTAIAKDGDIYCSNITKNCISVLSPVDFSVISEFGTAGSGDGELDFPCGLAFSKDGNLFVCDACNYRIQVFNQLHEFLFSFKCKNEPYSIAISDEGLVFVTQDDNVSVFSSKGVFIKKIGSGRGSGDGQLDIDGGWGGIAIDNDGNVIVGDNTNKRVQIFNSDGFF